MLAKEFQERVEAFVESHKTVSFNGKTLGQDLNLILEAVDQVNSLTELDVKIGGELLDMATLPSWVKPFVYPAKVAVLPDFSYPDLVDRPVAKADYVFNIPAITAASLKVGQLFKTKPEMITIKALRGETAMLSNVHFAVNGWVQQSGSDLFFPVPLKSSVSSVLGDEWGNMREDRMIDLFFARVFSM